ncbi:MAG: exodeoxyribonuclease VII small subunit, partial [Erysipelotrichaceae bacterium]|nr:exodeoxyribonuclease VII small subunit [Erysipelotrichaceae bacterium]
AEKMKFEQQMKKLQEIVDKLEKNDIELDESLKLYEEGLKLSKSLKEQLSAFEEKIKELNEEDE